VFPLEYNIMQALRKVHCLNCTNMLEIFAFIGLLVWARWHQALSICWGENPNSFAFTLNSGGMQISDGSFQLIAPATSWGKGDKLLIVLMQIKVVLFYLTMSILNLYLSLIILGRERLTF
jgi:hypothetical protein